jgi:hypothetical protein
MKTQYVRTLPQETQESIEKDLKAQQLNKEDIEAAMDSRLCDLSDTININKYL